MSGSPILQDGRLVGAVTHVLVNDPTRGYGILRKIWCSLQMRRPSARRRKKREKARDVRCCAFLGRKQRLLPNHCILCRNRFFLPNMEFFHGNCCIIWEYMVEFRSLRK